MKAFSIYTILLGLLALFTFDDNARQSGDAAQGAALAVNFGVFRNAAWCYARENQDFIGLVPTAELTVPHGWRAARSWTARMENGVCYVYGSATASEVAVVLREFHNSQAMGRNVNGRLEPGALSLPGFIPPDSLVSLMRVRS